jgi:hypothetical protein
MSEPTNDNARGEAGVEAKTKTEPRQYSAAPSCAKAAAVALFLHGILSLEQVQAMFDRNPAWRSA